MSNKSKKALTKKDKAKLSKRESHFIKTELLHIWVNRDDDRPLKQRASDIVKAISYVKKHTKY